MEDKNEFDQKGKKIIFHLQGKQIANQNLILLILNILSATLYTLYLYINVRIIAYFHIFHIVDSKLLPMNIYWNHNSLKIKQYKYCPPPLPDFKVQSYVMA